MRWSKDFGGRGDGGFVGARASTRGAGDTVKQEKGAGKKKKKEKRKGRRPVPRLWD